MSWTTFASLGVGPGTTPQLDANFNILSTLVPIACTVTGVNTLVLTSIEGAGPVSAYVNYMQFVAIAAATNITAVTANPLGLGALAVYKDTPAGPVVLTGSEIVANCEFTLIYDSALNGSIGGFHLVTAPIQLINSQTLTLNALTVTGTGSVGGLFSGASLAISGPASLASMSISGIGSLATANIGAGNATLSAASITGLFSGTSLSLNGGDALVRMQATLASVAFTQMVPFQFIQATITLANVGVNDAIVVSPISNFLGTFGAPTLSFTGFVSASGSIILRAQNLVTLTTIAGFTTTLRVVDLGFAT